MATTYFVLAGEASGDLHGAKLLAALKQQDPSARFVGMGGPRMADAGLEVAKDLEGMQVVGFWEVAKKYGFFREVFHKLLDRLKQERPTVLICIDYPGFNLRFAKKARELGIPIVYYIVPQVWAWKPKRAATMSEFIDRAYCVFDFEPPFFEKFRNSRRRMKTRFVGHPLLDRETDDIPHPSWASDRKTVSLLTGSRPAEFQMHGSPLAQGFRLANKKLGELNALMSVPGGVSGAALAEANGWLGGNGTSSEAGAPSTGGRRVLASPTSLEEGAPDFFSKLSAVDSSHASLLPAISDFSVVKSGTSTLEAGLRGNPLCVVYKGGWISYSIARMLVDIPVFSLVNIVLGRYAVPELLQGEVNPGRVAHEIERGLTDERHREAQRSALAGLPAKLGGPGASARAAQAILGFLSGNE